MIPDPTKYHNNIPLFSPPLTKTKCSSPQCKENVIKGHYPGKTLSVNTSPISAPLRLTGGGDSSFDCQIDMEQDQGNDLSIGTSLRPTKECQENVNLQGKEIGLGKSIQALLILN